MHIYLSHFMNESTPAYAGSGEHRIQNTSQIKQGASSNSMHLSISNHLGTHIDFPRHFSDSGKRINDYEPGAWYFDSVQLIDIQAVADQIIDETTLQLSDLRAETELLLIRTGFEAVRGEKKYWNNNPGLAPSLAAALSEKFPAIRAVGFDFISLSSFQNRELGRQAHKKFLVESDILVIEDMSLKNITEKIRRVIALPLMIDNADGSPMTVIAEVADD